MKFAGFLAVLLSVFCLPRAFAAESAGYCVALGNTPVLNTPDFASVFGGADGKSLKLDSSGLLRELEFIAFPGTVFKILDKLPGSHILRVETADYPYDGPPLYIDERFAAGEDFHPGDRRKARPAGEEAAEKLARMLGQKYLWGGNTESGVPLMLELYKPKGILSSGEARIRRLEGVDCTGLLYIATGGYTPRNTSSLVCFGRGVKISGLSAEGMADILRPLDLIVWAGHVIVVLDEDFVIESTMARGVHKSPVSERLGKLLETRAAADDWDSSSGRRFVVRRWVPK